jgi:hypothetical protein
MTATVAILNALNQSYGSASSKAFVAAVCEGEGGTAWNILFGGTLWTGSLAAFPPWPGVQLARGGTTHAAGAPQFEPATYAAIAKISGRTAFGPQDQIQNCWDLADTTFSSKTSVMSLHAALQAAGNSRLMIPTYLIKIWPGGCDSGFPKRFMSNLPLVRASSAPATAQMGLGEPASLARS